MGKEKDARLLHPLVYVVDDDEDMRGILRLWLEEAGYQVRRIRERSVYVRGDARVAPADGSDGSDDACDGGARSPPRDASDGVLGACDHLDGLGYSS